MKHIVSILMLLILVMGCSTSGRTMISQSQTSNVVDNKSTPVPPIAARPSDNKSAQVVAAVTSQVTPLQGIPVTLRYDYLNAEENLFTQVAVGHSYATYHVPYLGTGQKSIKAPLIILPIKEGSVCLIEDYSGVIKYLPIGNNWGINPNIVSYRGIVDENIELGKPGWGLATTFHPDKTPFSIKNIKIAGVANYTTGVMSDYDKKYIVINILNDKSEIIWSKYCKWRDLRNTQTTTGLPYPPSAVWRDIVVDNVTVDGDFTVDVLALSKTYNEIGEMYDYFAIAYEKFVKCGDATTNSFISENGKGCNPDIRLYDQYGDPVCFKLCIRVDGIY